MKTNRKSFAQIFAEAKKNLTYHVEGTILEFTEEVCRTMEAQSVTKAELAKRLNCQPAFVTKLLSGQNNFTLETMVKVALALESEIKVHLQGPNVDSHWVDGEKFKVTSNSVTEKFEHDQIDVAQDFKKPKELDLVKENYIAAFAPHEEFALAA